MIKSFLPLCGCPASGQKAVSEWSPPHKKTALYQGGVPTLHNFCGAAVFSCKGWAVRPPLGARIR